MNKNKQFSETISVFINITNTGSRHCIFKFIFSIAFAELMSIFTKVNYSSIPECSSLEAVEGNFTSPCLACAFVEVCAQTDSLSPSFASASQIELDK